VSLDFGRHAKKADTVDFQPRWIDPIQAKYRDYTLWTIPAPASGAIWLSAMGMLSQLDRTEEGTVLNQHRVTEALRVSCKQSPHSQELTLPASVRTENRAGRSSLRSRSPREAGILGIRERKQEKIRDDLGREDIPARILHDPQGSRVPVTPSTLKLTLCR
jgi:hypothetical protein